LSDEIKKDWVKNPELRNELVKKMVLLLREGHRMLDEVCPVCSAILFLKKDVGLRYCPNCDVYLATPEELNKLDSSKVKIIGEIAEGGVLKLEEATIIRSPEGISSREAHEREVSALAAEKTGEKTGEDVNKQLESMIKRLLYQMSYALEIEINRLSVKDLLEILKSLLEIRRLL